MTDPRPTPGAGTPAEYRTQVTRLIQRLSEAEGAIQALASGELDAVVDPATAVPILLSRAQSAVSRSEARYRDLITRAPSIVCEVSPDGTILFINEAVRAILGHDPADLVGADWHDRLVPRFDGAATDRMLREMRRGDVTGFELPLRTAADGQRWVAINSSNRYTRDGRLESIVLFGIDVTDRREAEDRARELAEAQVARAEAEAANRAKTDFLAVMSHELRTPLNAILGYVQLVTMGLRGPVTDEQTADLGRIKQSTIHLLGLINNLLNFARLDAGRVEFSVHGARVQEILDTVETLTRLQASENGLALEITRCEPHIEVWVDSEKVQQILINLVSNAVKFTPRGGSIRVECVADPEWVRITVHDTGPGIPESKHQRIFEPFIQVDRNLTRGQEGVGLGLAISRDLAVAMDGDITLKSAVGEGSAFTLKLPRVRAGAAAANGARDEDLIDPEPM